jgi:hypothetical protein
MLAVVARGACARDDESIEPDFGSHDLLEHIACCSDGDRFDVAGVSIGMLIDIPDDFIDEFAEHVFGPKGLIGTLGATPEFLRAIMNPVIPERRFGQLAFVSDHLRMAMVDQSYCDEAMRNIRVGLGLFLPALLNDIMSVADTFAYPVFRLALELSRVDPVFFEIFAGMPFWVDYAENLPATWEFWCAFFEMEGAPVSGPHVVQLVKSVIMWNTGPASQRARVLAAALRASPEFVIDFVASMDPPFEIGDLAFYEEEVNDQFLCLIQVMTGPGLSGHRLIRPELAAHFAISPQDDLAIAGFALVRSFYEAHPTGFHDDEAMAISSFYAHLVGEASSSALRSVGLKRAIWGAARALLVIIGSDEFALIVGKDYEVFTEMIRDATELQSEEET